MTDQQGEAAKAEEMPPKRQRAVLHPISGSVRLLRRWWRIAVQSEVDQPAIITKIKADCSFTPRYSFLICMSAGIAILGLLLSSPAVVIGAMLLSPLMYPIMAVGFASAVGDSAWLKDSGWALFMGTLIAVLFSAFVVLLSPLQTVTPEIAARTRPNLFDLGVAVFSGLAGAYAMIRGGLGTIVGVAIAVALMPPLAVIGFGLATLNWTVFAGSLLLYFTNLMVIALTATIMAWLYGFRSYMTERQTQLQIFAMIVVFVGLAIPLGLSLVQIGHEANISRSANGLVKDQFGPRARVSQIDIDFNADPILISASVFTPTIRSGAEEQSSRVLSRTFNEPIQVQIEQYKVETGDNAAQAELAALRAREQQQAVETQVSKLRENLALVAGVEQDDVIVDTSKRRAIVMAKPLPGASLQTYYALEQRMVKQMPDWAINIQPPPAALPDLVVAENELTNASKRRLEWISWAALRSPMAIRMTGAKADMGIVALELAKQNLFLAKTETENSQSGRVKFDWQVAGQTDTISN
ncbi:MAG: DUF389 domain-containing protein [Parasphingorhabdus sp.]